MEYVDNDLDKAIASGHEDTRTREGEREGSGEKVQKKIVACRIRAVDGDLPSPLFTNITPFGDIPSPSGIEMMISF